VGEQSSSKYKLRPAHSRASALLTLSALAAFLASFSAFRAALSCAFNTIGVQFAAGERGGRHP
jgi:hypothetical protein